MTTSPSTSAVFIGASGGIGRALVCALAGSESYAPIFAFSRSEPSFPHDIRTHPVDLSDEATIAAAAAKVGEAGPVGLVVVATGILHQNGVSPEKTFKALEPAAMAAVFSVNTIGPALVAKHVVPVLARQGRCVFAALSARVGSIDDNRLGGWYAYRASKAGFKSDSTDPLDQGGPQPTRRDRRWFASGDGRFRLVAALPAGPERRRCLPARGKRGSSLTGD